MRINWVETLLGVAIGEGLEKAAPKIFDPGAPAAKEGKSGGPSDPKLGKANFLGWGKEDERLFWKAVEMASKPIFNKSGVKDDVEGVASMAELRVVTDFSGMTHAHKRALILYIGHKEDIVQVSEEKKNADGTPFDPTKNVGKKGGGGGQPAKTVVTQEVANTDGRQKIIFLVRLMRDELGYTEKDVLPAPPDPSTKEKAKEPKTFSAADKTKAKKAIKDWLIKSGMLRDMSDQVEESAEEFKQTALGVANTLGLNHQSFEELEDDVDDFRLKAKLALAKARAKARR